MKDKFEIGVDLGEIVEPAALYPTVIVDDVVNQTKFSVQDTFKELIRSKVNSIYGLPKGHDVEEKPETEEKEWIWVEGYKGTKADLTAYDGFQYEMEKVYTMPDDVEIEVCTRGFHLCKELEDVFRHYSIISGNRFFQVRALVCKKDVEMYGKTIGTSYGGRRLDKWVAKAIVLERELTLDEIFVEECYADWTDDEKRKAISHGTRSVIEDRNFVKLVAAGYSETFSRYVSEYEGKTSIALAVASEPGLSMDMKVFAIMYEN